MKRTRHTAVTAMVLVLAGCVAAPVREVGVSVAPAVAHAAPGAPRLPASDEAYLDPAWFRTPLTAERAVQAALLNNPQVRAELSRLDSAQAERIQAGLISNPMGSLMALRPDGGGRYELDYNLVESLFDLMTRSRRIAVADAAQRRVEAEVIGRLLGLAQGTEAAYYDALAAEARYRLQQERLLIEDQFLRLLIGQAGEGSVGSALVLDQESESAMQSHEVQAAQAAVAQARAALAERLSLPSANAFKLPESLPEFEFPGLDAERLQALAAAHRPELEGARAEVGRMQSERELATGTLRAVNPGAGIAGTRESGGQSLNGLVIQMAVPVFDTGQARRQLADSRVAQSGFAAEAIRRQVPLEVERALAMLLAASNAAVHSEHHLDQKTQMERLARNDYQQGAIDFARYLQATRARITAALQRVEASQSQWEALVDLQRATGVAASAWAER